MTLREHIKRYLLEADNDWDGLDDFLNSLGPKSKDLGTNDDELVDKLIQEWMKEAERYKKKISMIFQPFWEQQTQKYGPDIVAMAARLTENEARSLRQTSPMAPIIDILLLSAAGIEEK